MKNIIAFTLFILFCQALMSQDVMVQTFDYNSENRDGVFTFPDRDHNSYERILMHYSMRCKDGLVSTGSERNKGCGEWDYSCNTYVVDSTRVDSLKARSDVFNMPGFSGDIFNYTDSPTYSFYESIKQGVTYDQTFTQRFTAIADSDATADYQFGEDGSGIRLNYYVSAEELMENDLDRISGIRLDVESGEAIFKNMKVFVANTDEMDLENALESDLDWKQVLNDNVTLNMEDGLLKFYDDYRWDDTSNIVIRISYDNCVSQDFTLNAEDFSVGKAIVTSLKNEKYKEIGTSGKIRVNETFENISDEMTITFWQKGADNLPVNTTILEGNDASNSRQVNIHHPWSNGQIYWDCGNDGSGYDRINRPAGDVTDFKNKWNHWAFTKNAVSGEMKMYLNGELWHSGTDKFKKIDLNALVVGGSITDDNLSYYGNVDELTVWSVELDQATIQSYMNKTIDDKHPQRENLMLYFDFNEDGNQVMDLSGNGRHGVVDGLVASREWTMEEYSLNTNTSNFLPNHSLVKGVYSKSTEEYTVLDSLVNLPQKINHYGLNGTDLELLSSGFYYEAREYPIINESGVNVGSVSYPIAGTFERGEIIYYSKVPMAFELMSFVTPYGIGIDFGLEGLTWTFDVTDFGPILKGDKRIYLTGGGQFQEEMDIQFEFIEGTPDRDVIDIKQIWPVRSTGYLSILDNWRYEPRQFTYDPNVSAYVIRTAITGHGQEGEFIPRIHTIDVDGFTDSWQVWKECAENPVYPQGGTWVYDRAGWCPGMATDVRTFDATPYFQFANTPFIDYTLNTASGDSRYYVNSQLLEYGQPNKSNDAGISDIIHPNTKIEHGRFNPSCHAPKIVLKNHGANPITSVKIIYGIVGGTQKEYTWTGDLSFLREATIELPANIDLTSGGDGSQFFAKVEYSNDENDNNNEMITDIIIPDNFEEDVVIELRTNLAANETSYTVEDIDGNIIHSRLASTLSANTTYRDTLKNLNGCFKIFVQDSGSDGISWWANNDGNGYVRVKEVNGSWKDIATDFGAFVEYNFSAGITSSINDLETITDLRLFPNPGKSELFISGLKGWDNSLHLNIIDAAGKSILNGNFDKHTISERSLDNIVTLNKGFYFINVNDTKRTATLKYIRL